MNASLTIVWCHLLNVSWKFRRLSNNICNIVLHMKSHWILLLVFMYLFVWLARVVSWLEPSPSYIGYIWEMRSKINFKCAVNTNKILRTCDKREWFHANALICNKKNVRCKSITFDSFHEFLFEHSNAPCGHSMHMTPHHVSAKWCCLSTRFERCVVVSMTVEYRFYSVMFDDYHRQCVPGWPF